MKQPLMKGRLSDERREQVKALSKQAGAGDPWARQELRQLLSEDWPVWRQVAELEKSTEEVICHMVAPPENALAQELHSLQLTEMRHALLGSDPSPLERLLVGRVVLLWLQATIADRTCAVAMDQQAPSLELWSRHAERANRRLLNACRTLALVRRLELPLVLQQLNIQAGQVMVAGQKSSPSLGVGDGAP
jgi:hypothetical protein